MRFLYFFILVFVSYFKIDFSLAADSRLQQWVVHCSTTCGACYPDHRVAAVGTVSEHCFAENPIGGPMSFPPCCFAEAPKSYPKCVRAGNDSARCTVGESSSTYTRIRQSPANANDSDRNIQPDRANQHERRPSQRNTRAVNQQ